MTVDPHGRNCDSRGMVHTDHFACRSCKTWYTVHKHDVTVANTGTLRCPHCGGEIVTWAGHFFYTLAVDPPKSSHEIDVAEKPE